MTNAGSRFSQRLPGHAAEAYPLEVAGVRLPDTAAALGAWRLARDTSADFLLNHSARTFVFASLVFAKDGIKVDEELCFIASVLHDVGLTEMFASASNRFEVDGADVAKDYLARAGFSDADAETAWDAIALHSSVSIAERKSPIVASVAIGAACDVVGARLDRLDDGEVRATLDAFPRLGMNRRFTAAVLDYARKKPLAALFTFADPLLRREADAPDLPTLRELIAMSPWDE
jgi:hypothetical protein